MKLRRALFLAGLAAAAAAAAAAAEPAPDAQALSAEAAKRAEQYKFQFKPPEYQNKERVHELGKEGRQRGQAELNRMIEQHQARRAADGLPPLPGSAPEETAGDKRAPLSGRVVLALSSSMPETMLRDYMAQVDGKREAIVVLRGFVGGARTVAPTGKLLEKIRRRIEGDPTAGHRSVEMMVDPLLFRSLGIDRVPAVVWLGGVQDIKHCDQEDYQAAVVAYGATSIEAALREINRNGGSVPADVIKKFGGTGWEAQAK